MAKEIWECPKCGMGMYQKDINRDPGLAYQCKDCGYVDAVRKTAAQTKAKDTVAFKQGDRVTYWPQGGKKAVHGSVEADNGAEVSVRIDGGTVQKLPKSQVTAKAKSTVIKGGPGTVLDRRTQLHRALDAAIEYHYAKKPVTSKTLSILKKEDMEKMTGKSAANSKIARDVREEEKRRCGLCSKLLPNGHPFEYCSSCMRRLDAGETPASIMIKAKDEVRPVGGKEDEKLTTVKVGKPEEGRFGKEFSLPSKKAKDTHGQLREHWLKQGAPKDDLGKVLNYLACKYTPLADPLTPDNYESHPNFQHLKRLANDAKTAASAYCPNCVKGKRPNGKVCGKCGGTGKVSTGAKDVMPV